MRRGRDTGVGRPVIDSGLRRLLLGLKLLRRRGLLELSLRGCHRLLPGKLRRRRPGLIVLTSRRLRRLELRGRRRLVKLAGSGLTGLNGELWEVGARAEVALQG